MKKSGYRAIAVPQTPRGTESTFPVLSPLTAGRMLRGYRKLVGLQKEADRSVKTVQVDGVAVRRVLLRTGAKYYRSGLEIFLLSQLFERLERALDRNIKDLVSVLTESAQAEFSEEWVDVAGQLMPQRRFEALCEAIEMGRIETSQEVDDQLEQIATAYDDDAWAWSCWAYGQVFDRQLNELRIDDCGPQPDRT